MTSTPDQSRRSDRLFVPLATEPYEWFRSDAKRWELRRERGAFQRKYLRSGRSVELRRGYSDKTSSLWGTIGQVVEAPTLRHFFDRVPYGLVIPGATSESDAIAQAAAILSVGPDEPVRFVGFEVRRDRHT